MVIRCPRPVSARLPYQFLLMLYFVVRYMMGSSMVKPFFPISVRITHTDTSFKVLAASRQSFAFARDGALPFSSILYRMNGYTGTPVNTAWFVAAISTLLGLLSLAALKLSMPSSHYL